MEISDLLRRMVEMGGSDLHLKVGAVPFVRVDGTLIPAEFPALEATDTESFAGDLLPPQKASEFGDTQEADFGYTLSGVGRFRVNVFRQRGVVGLAVRRVRAEIPSFEELMLPPVVRTLADGHRGLVLVTGPTGTGKTTTIAAVIGHINRTRNAHIVTIEDPIEVLHEDHRSIVDQREVGIDTMSYAAALRHVVRQDPDVIFIGEIRDAPSAEAAIQAAETGHFVISTLHTTDATETINRILDMFPPQQQAQVRVSLASGLRGILSQRLLPRANGRGRVPAVEVLVNTGRVQERILKPESTFEITDVMNEGEFYGMQLFERALVRLVMDGLVREEDASDASTNPHDFALALKAARMGREADAAANGAGDPSAPVAAAVPGAGFTP
ncbi:MAG TPA: PilT/PilU family type 4a pilus ATPase [Actinomycetota bacterium]|jgi:twitching motility protein PilT